MNGDWQPDEALQALLAALVDGDPTSEQRAALARRLRDDAAARAYYIRTMSLHARLHARHASLPLDEAAAAPPARSAGRATRRLYDFFARPTPLSLAVATLFIVSLLGLMAAVAPPIYHATTRWASPAPAPNAPTTIAEITDSYDARWAESADRRRGARLRPGESLDLLEGFAEVTFDDSATVLVHGPATLTVDQVQRGEQQFSFVALAQGKLTARVPASASGFTVETALVEAIDVGTEFGVATERNATDVVVFQGQVDARPKASATAARPLSIQRGQAFRFERGAPQGRVVDRPQHNFVRLPSTDPQAESDPYAAAVLADRPKAYWRLNDEGALAVNRTGGWHGMFRGDVAQGALPRPGAASDSGSAHFDGADDYLALDYNAALNGRDFTIEAWARLDALPREHASIVTSRADQPLKMGYTLYVSPKGEWQLWTGSGAGWAELAGPVATVGQWTHVAGTFQHIRTHDGGLVTGIACLYVDGQFAVERAGTPYMPQRDAARPLRIAAGATENDSPRYYFPGQIADVAIYGRALSQEEIKKHFAAATQQGAAAND